MIYLILLLALLLPFKASAQTTNSRTQDGAGNKILSTTGTPATSDRGLLTKDAILANRFPAAVSSPSTIAAQTASAIHGLMYGWDGTNWRQLALDATGAVSMTGVVDAEGPVAHDAAASAVFPLLEGCYANAAAPADVSADVDAVRAWCLRNGARAVQMTFAGVLATTGNGVSGTGVQRVTIASDSTGQITANAGTGTFVVDSEMPAASTIVENTVTPSVPGVASFNFVYDGTNWDFARSATLAQGSATAGQNGVLTQGAVTTAAPTYTTGNTNPISLQTDGSQRVAVTNTPTVTLSQTGTNNDVDATVTNFPTTASTSAVSVRCVNTTGTAFETCGGAGGSGGTSATDQSVWTAGTDTGTPVMGAVDDTTPSTCAENTKCIGRLTANRALHVSPRAGDGTVLLPTAAALADNTANPTTTGIASYNMCFDGTTWDRCTPSTVTQGSVTAGQSGVLMQGAVTTAAPTYLTGNTNAVSLTTGGAMRTECTNCSGSGASHIDNAIFTGGTDDVAPMGALFDNTPPAIADGNLGAPRMNANRQLLVDGSGVTQPVSGTVTANQGGAPWSQNLTQLNSVALASPFDGDSGVGTQNLTGVSLRKTASGGSVELGTATDPVRVDPTGTTTQPVSGTVTANAGTNLNTSALALSATQTDGTQKAIVRGGAKGTTSAADVTGTASGANHQALDVAIYDGVGNQITTFGGGTQYTEDAASVADPVGNQLIARRRDTLATETTADGDVTALNSTSKGELYVKQTDSVTVTQGTGTNLHIVCDSGCGGAAVDGTASGTITAAGQRVSLALAGYKGAAFTLTGTWTAAIKPQVSFDGGTTWVDVQFYDGSASVMAFGISAIFNGNRSFVVPGGASHVAVTASSFSSGTVNVALRVTEVNATPPFASLSGAGSMSQVGMLATGNMLFNSATLQMDQHATVAHGTDSVGAAIASSGLLAERDDTTPSTVTENQFGNLRISSNRNLYSTIRDAAGNERGANVNASNELQVSATGTVTVTQATAANLNVRPDTSGATAAAPPARANYVGGLTSGATGGLLTGIAVCDSFANVNVSTATTTLLVTGVAGRHVRICSINLVTAAANNVALISGTGATCATGTTGMNGGTTAASGWNFAANAGISQGSGLGTINQTNATGDSVCIVTSAATQLSGRVAYAIY